MSQRTAQRRNLAAPDDPNTSADPTHKKQPKSSISTTATAKPRHRHHPSDRDPSGPSSTIHTISKHFSKLYTSHHHKVPSKPRIDTHLQSKTMAITSATEDTSSKPITKSAHQHRRTVAEMEKDRLRASVTGAIDNNNNNSWKESHHQSHHKTDKIKKFSKMESHDLKKQPASLLSRSLDSGLRGAREENYNQRPQFSLAVAAGVGGRRRSFYNSQTELADFFSRSGVKAVSVDMPPFMQVHAVDCARKTFDSLEKFSSKTLAFTLKKEFDGVYGPAWHCVVGTSFGSFVTHSVGGFLYFSMDHKLYILLFKTTVQRADQY